MKKFKLFLIALLFAGGVTAAFAFSSSTEPAPAAQEISWFLYNPVHSGGTGNPQNYVKISGEPECDSEGSLCAIESNVMPGDEPDLTVIYDEREKP